jgi:hypothetical protein
MERLAEAAVGDAENVGENEPKGAACGTWNAGVRLLGRWPAAAGAGARRTRAAPTRRRCRERGMALRVAVDILV